MTKTPTTDVDATLAQINELAEAGCEIIRVAVPTKTDAKALRAIVKDSPIPVVADVHFTGELALAAIEAGVHALRINPGNMRNKESLAKVANAAREAGIPIRVGVNSGSVFTTEVQRTRRKTREKENGKQKRISPVSSASLRSKEETNLLVETAIGAAQFLEECDFHDIILSAKSSSVLSTVQAYRRLAERTDYPLHLGVTAAGPATCAAVRSAIGIGALLIDGIGDTIRVSVTGDPVQEIAIAKEILESVELRRFGPRIISCPTCGRCEVDLLELVTAVQNELAGLKKPVTVAIMGCVVNGPGEASEADIGAAFARSEAWIFKNGRKLRKVARDRVARELIREIEEC
jgi:(E)-4-hydroxy-3-methylbut-2-enyl-diphosphate synthase